MVVLAGAFEADAVDVGALEAVEVGLGGIGYVKAMLEVNGAQMVMGRG